MKKLLSIILFSALSICIWAQSFRISDSEFNIEGAGGFSLGKTNKALLVRNCPIDTKTIFKTKADLEEYIDNYKQDLNNTRAFDTIDIRYEMEQNPETKIYDIKLYFDLVDTKHFMLVPYPKYSTNGGFTLKLKLKDKNFLGTMETLSADINTNYDANKKWNFGLNFSYSYPFTVGIFNASWNNDIGIDYQIGKKKPTFGSSIGFGFSLPKDFYSINFGFSQGISYNDYIKFSESLNFSTPITLYKLSNFSTVNYSPSINFGFNWDKNLWQGKDNAIDRFSMSFGHSLSNSKINWDGDYRKGYSFSLSNNFSFNFMTNTPDYVFKCHIVPTISFEAQYFNHTKLFNGPLFDHIGFNSRLYAFTVIDIPERYGSGGNQDMEGRLRGVRSLSSPWGIVVNMDFPISFFTTNMPINTFNFNLQVSPFIDIGLSYDKDKAINIKKGSYCGGLELLVNPIRFSGYTIRASIGFDMLEALHYDGNKLKGLWHNKEIFIGLDLHY